LETIVCGACWTHGRNGMERSCLWCGEHDTVWHRYWECSQLHVHQSELVQKSNKYKDMFQERISGPPQRNWAACLWGRGLLSETLVQWSKATVWEHEDVRKQSYNFDEVVGHVDEIATYGSGGNQCILDAVRRVGCAVAAVQAKLNDKGDIVIKNGGVIMSEVPGRQTVPRAEFYALINARRATVKNPDRSRTIWSDCAFSHLKVQRKKAETNCSKIQMATCGRSLNFVMM